MHTFAFQCTENSVQLTMLSERIPKGLGTILFTYGHTRKILYDDQEQYSAKSIS